MNKQQAGNRTYEETIQTIQDIQKQQSLTYTQAVEEGIEHFDRLFAYAFAESRASFLTDKVKGFLRSFASSIKQSVIEEIEGKKSSCCHAKCYASWNCGNCGRELDLKEDFCLEKSILLEAMKKEAV